MENHAGKGVRNQEALRLCFIAPVPPPYGGIANWLNLICRFMENSRKAMEYTIINTAPHKRITEGRNLWDKIFVSGIDMLRKRKECNPYDNKRTASNYKRSCYVKNGKQKWDTNGLSYSYGQNRSNNRREKF